MSLNLLKNKSIKINFILYLIVLVLFNIASSTIFFRVDLSSNKKYSLSKASKTAVSEIKEPLTVKAFFSENLPGRYSNLKREFTDLMEEYSLTGNNNFNYKIYIINKDGNSIDESGRNIKDLAADYSINPIQIQTIENDEVKLQSVYMGITLITGNMIKTIPSIASINNLEYTITGSINKISKKISALLSLEDNININLYFSSSLNEMGEGLSRYPDEIKAVTGKLNKLNYNKLTYNYFDPDSSPVQSNKNYTLTSFNLQSNDGSSRKVFADLVISNGDQYTVITLLQKNIFGYDIISPDKLSDNINGIIEKSLGLNKEIAYLAEYGTLDLFQNPYAQNQQGPSLNNFNTMISEHYSLSPITTLKEGIPDNIKTLLIVSPKEQLSSWDLYQIDQYIMKGNSVGFFIDTHSEVIPENQNPYNPQPPVYIPRDTGIDGLLKNYGVDISKSYVLDENCYKQIGQNNQGNISETTFYFAPEILSENINKDIPFISNIKGLIMLNASPLVIDPDLTKGENIEILFSSSDKSWEMKENINLYNPITIFPPSDKIKSKFPLAVIIEGNVNSFFNGKPIPEREFNENENEKSLISSDLLTKDEEFIPNTNQGKVFVIGTSAVLTDNILDRTGTSPNSVFIYNVLDKLNGRDDFAEMRSKTQVFNPLRETTPGERSFIKGFSIIGLPVLVIFSGLIAWLLWTSRKKKIELLFRRNN
jgi:ABC-type uncharacterized transport system involved in gliding motility auxiliary subunit